MGILLKSPQPLRKMLSMLGFRSATQDQGHEYRSPTPTGAVYSFMYGPVLIVSSKDLRSPCPFLNTMANHVSLSMLKLV